MGQAAIQSRSCSEQRRTGAFRTTLDRAPTLLRPHSDASSAQPPSDPAPTTLRPRSDPAPTPLRPRSDPRSDPAPTSAPTLPRPLLRPRSDHCPDPGPDLCSDLCSDLCPDLCPDPRCEGLPFGRGKFGRCNKESDGSACSDRNGGPDGDDAYRCDRIEDGASNWHGEPLSYGPLRSRSVSASSAVMDNSRAGDAPLVGSSVGPAWPRFDVRPRRAGQDRRPRRARSPVRALPARAAPLGERPPAPMDPRPDGHRRPRAGNGAASGQADRGVRVAARRSAAGVSASGRSSTASATRYGARSDRRSPTELNENASRRRRRRRSRLRSAAKRSSGTKRRWRGCGPKSAKRSSRASRWMAAIRTWRRRSASRRPTRRAWPSAARCCGSRRR